MSGERRTEEAAHVICCMTVQAYWKAEECLWPPLPSFLLSEEAKPPVILINFMKILLARKESLRTKRENRFYYHPGYLLLCFKWSVEYGQASCPWYRYPIIHRKCAINEHAESCGYCISHTCVLELETAVCHNIAKLQFVVSACFCRQ